MQPLDALRLQTVFDLIDQNDRGLLRGLALQLSCPKPAHRPPRCAGNVPPLNETIGPTRAGHSARTGQDTWLTELLERASYEDGGMNKTLRRSARPR
jgi:hypothetical protein